jgi:hypothetical protein
MHLQVYGEKEKGGNTRARSLASSDRAGRGVAWRGEAMGAGAQRARE